MQRDHTSVIIAIEPIKNLVILNNTSGKINTIKEGNVCNNRFVEKHDIYIVFTEKTFFFYCLLNSEPVIIDFFFSSGRVGGGFGLTHAYVQFWQYKWLCSMCNLIY